MSECGNTPDQKDAEIARLKELVSMYSRGMKENLVECIQLNTKLSSYDLALAQAHGMLKECRDIFEQNWARTQRETIKHIDEVLAVEIGNEHLNEWVGEAVAYADQGGIHMLAAVDDGAFLYTPGRTIA
jgi:hypothetical protein